MFKKTPVLAGSSFLLLPFKLFGSHSFIHSFILVQESKVFDVVLRFKKRTGGNLSLCLYPTCYAVHSEQKQVQRLKIDNLIELLSIAYS